MRRSVWAAAISLIALGATSAVAAAQSCRGTAPFGRATGSDYGFEAALVFPEEGTGIYGAFKWAPSLNLALNFDAQFVSDVGGGADVWVFGGDGAFRFVEGNPQQFPLDVCFLTGFRFFVFSDLGADEDLNGFLIPIGVTLGNDFPLGQSSVRIAPYFSPVFTIQRASFESGTFEVTETEGLFHVDFGASFIFAGGWYAGIGLSLGDGDRATTGDTEIRLRAGWLLGR